MRPRRGDPPLTVIDLSKVTIGSLQQLLEESEYFGFPCVLSTESQQLAGFLTRKDIQTLLGELVFLDNETFLTVVCCSPDVCSYKYHDLHISASLQFTPPLLCLLVASQWKGC